MDQTLYIVLSLFSFIPLAYALNHKMKKDLVKDFQEAEALYGKSSTLAELNKIENRLNRFKYYSPLRSTVLSAIEIYKKQI